jgi:hypothetical protein
LGEVREVVDVDLLDVPFDGAVGEHVAEILRVGLARQIRVRCPSNLSHRDDGDEDAQGDEDFARLRCEVAHHQPIVARFGIQDLLAILIARTCGSKRVFKT